ncbi:hypothetical protein BGW80DRAFT_1498366 [Lactifluus volemus]|nr:hypothetical protein BGW80DRAFT_1498366 [Lactifluus volemus]
MRMYRCSVEGCYKCFARGEHLKRHVRSIHTNEKPHKCPIEGCGRISAVTITLDSICAFTRVMRWVIWSATPELSPYYDKIHSPRVRLNIHASLTPQILFLFFLFLSPLLLPLFFFCLLGPRYRWDTAVLLKGAGTFLLISILFVTIMPAS